MEYEKIKERIQGAVENNPENFAPYQDLFDLIRLEGKDDRRPTFNDMLWLRKQTATQCRNSKLDSAIIDFAELNKKTYLWMARDDFDSYCIYLEWNRKPDKRFYLPRRKILKRAVNAMQKLADDELDELFLSQPPRTGKSTSKQPRKS